MGKACRDMAEALRDCMVQQQCMADGTKTLKQCLHDRAHSHECQEYRVAYFECKRGQLDMRQRIRGPKGGMSKPVDGN
ncbi:cytochrome c oxidase assembly factor 5 [Phytophthora cinnamomi]|uniref:cytochrome c oxidase assembly factor 5 n=1 Tax=Phytophthora cinnamomi TaxID=4785 RepID=UPI00355A7632|nr:cytochrome c oxidase assembly factor 5 [Phytophthora cinnamomi]